MVLKNAFSNLLDHIVVGIPCIHYNFVAMFCLDSGFLAERFFATVFLVIVFVVILVPFVGGLDGGKPVPVFFVIIVFIFSG